MLFTALIVTRGAGAPQGPPAKAICLEFVARLPAEHLALAVAASPQQGRIYLADGSNVREYLLLAPGTVIPSAGIPVTLPGRPAALAPSPGGVYAAAEDGVHLVDPLRQQIIRSSTGYGARGLDVTVGYVYAAVQDLDRNSCGLYVLDQDLSRIAALTDYCEPPCCDLIGISVADVAVASSQACVVGMRYGGFAGIEEGFLAVVDVSDPARPTDLTEHTLTLRGIPQAVDVVGDYAFVALDALTSKAEGRGAGLSIVDIADPREPKLTGHLDTSSGLTDVVVAQPYAFATDDQGRVLAMSVSDPAAPSLAGYYATGSKAHSLLVEGTHVYVADGAGGLLILQFTTVPDPTPTPRLESEEGTLRQVQASFCQAGETHMLSEASSFLYSDWLVLDGYLDQYVRIWGWPVDSPECRVLNARQIEPAEPPTSLPTVTVLPIISQARVYLPILVRTWFP